MNLDSEIEALIELLKCVKTHISIDSDLLWTSYVNAFELRQEIDLIIEKLRLGDPSGLKETFAHFAPSSTFQLHSLMNNWSDVYLKLAVEFDRIYNNTNEKRSE